MTGGCQNCGEYFSESFAACPLCGSELTLVELVPEGSWVVVAVARNATDAEILGGLLAANGVPYVVRERGVSMYPAPDSGLELALVCVPDGSAREATNLREQAERGELQLRDQDLEGEP